MVSSRLAGATRHLRWTGLLLGLIAVVFGFFPWVAFRIPATPQRPEYTNSLAAFASGIPAWVPMVLLVLGGLLALPQRKWLSAVWLGLSVVAFGLTVYRWITVDTVSAGELNVSSDEFGELVSITNAYSDPGVGLYVTLILAVVSGVAALVTFRLNGKKKYLDSPA